MIGMPSVALIDCFVGSKRLCQWHREQWGGGFFFPKTLYFMVCSQEIVIILADVKTTYSFSNLNNAASMEKEKEKKEKKPILPPLTLEYNGTRCQCA